MLLNYYKIISFYFVVSFSFLSCANYKLHENYKNYGPKLTNKVPPDTLISHKKINWKKEIIYFLLIDRFYDGDKTNNRAGSYNSHVLYNPNIDNKEALKTYQGGDLQGVIDKLSYLKDLGITTIWLSPVYDNADSDFLSWWPYHGYHPLNFYSVENHFGSLEKLKELITKAHSMGFKVLLDIIYNHTAYQHPWVKKSENWNDLGFSKWFHYHSDVDSSSSISNWQDQKELENKELYGLPDFDQSNPHVYDFLMDVSRFWILNTGCDGFRLDGVKHISKNFWKKINKDIHEFAGKDFLLLGEVFDGNTQYVASYKDVGFDSLFDIPLYYVVRRVFAQGAPFTILSDQLKKSRKLFYGIIPGTLIDNHDVIRFSYKAKTNVEKKILMALTLISTLNGIPVIYYGTEVGLEGGPSLNLKTGESTDYLNRLMMPWGRIKDKQNMISNIKKLLHSRKKHKSLYDGKFIELYKTLTIYVYAKVSSNDFSLIAFNNSSVTQEISFKIPYNLISGKIKSLFSGKTVKVTNGKVKITLPSLKSDIYVYKGEVSPLPETYDDTVKISKEQSKDFKLVDFYFSAKETKYETVSIAGEFNSWNPDIDQFSYSESNKRWEVQVPIKSGKYRYKFVLNGNKWIYDKNAKELENDPYGSKNSIISVD